MPRRLRGILCTVLLAFAVLAGVGAQRQDAHARPIVILVSIDGYRWDYTERFQPPTITRLAAEGVRAEGLIPTFPSKTFPNHYTIVTGLHPARHGILSNNIVDPVLPGRFTLANREVQQDTRWWGGEPLWVGAERQGHVAATMFWPGSDVEIAGDRPTYWRAYEQNYPNDQRVDDLLAWLDRPEPQRPTFLTLYFSDVDDAGHDHGPNAEETREAVLRIDRTLDRLIAGVTRLGLAPRVHYVIVSDHGMAELSPERVIVLDDYLDLSTVDLIDSAPIVGINPGPGVSAEAVYAALKDKHPALTVYRRESLPEEYGLRNHPRLPAVIGVADEGWHPTTRSTNRPAHEFSRGNHGYDPKHRSMHGLFLAHGSMFRSGIVVPAFANVHLYELLCRVLGVQAASNDGDPAATAGILR